MEIYVPNKNDKNYYYFPISTNFIEFKVKSNIGAHICLSTVPFFTSQPYIEFVITLQSSTSKLQLQKKGDRVRDKNSFVSHHTTLRENLLNESEFKGFWISFKDGNYKFGCEGETKPLLEWINPEPIDINYFGICSYQTGALWKIGGGECTSSKSLSDLGSSPSHLPTWVPASNGVTPPGAIPTGGGDFIARVKHEKHGKIPGRLSTTSKTCHYGVMGEEHNSKEYEVLCGGSGSWAPVINGKIPNNAFACSEINIKGKFYIGRGRYDKKLISGKIYPSDGLCLIAYMGKEYILNNYEIYVF